MTAHTPSDRVIAFCGSLAGTGKTITAFTIAHALAARGNRVLFIDADSYGFGKIMSFWATVRKRAHAPALLTVSPSSKVLSHLSVLAEEHDYVVVDCATGDDQMERVAKGGAGRIVLPYPTRRIEKAALRRTARRLRELMDEQKGELQGCILLTLVSPGSCSAVQARAEMVGYGVPLLATTLHRRVAYEYALAIGLPVTEFAPTDAAAFEVRSLLQELKLVACSPAEQDSWRLNGHRLTRAEEHDIEEAHREMWRWSSRSNRAGQPRPNS